MHDRKGRIGTVIAGAGGQGEQNSVTVLYDGANLDAGTQAERCAAGELSVLPARGDGFWTGFLDASARGDGAESEKRRALLATGV